MENIPSIREKCIGAMLGSAIGDALGWPYEFRSKNTSSKELISGDSFIAWTRRSGGQYWSHLEQINPGEYSDDTQMILAVARSVIAGDWKEFFTTKELPFWLDYERGGGRALKNAAKVFKENKVPWNSNERIAYYNAGGNGAVMRILPHVIAHAIDLNIDNLMKDCISDSILTHGHPRAVLGATCYAYTLHKALVTNDVLEFGQLINIAIDGVDSWGVFHDDAVPEEWKRLAPYDYSDTWSIYVESMLDQLNYIKSSLKKGLLGNDKEVLTQLHCFDKTNGAGDVAILASLYLASKYANNPALGIKISAFTVGMDTDTVASITGGLLGMICGTAWIPPEWRAVQDYHCFINIVDILLSKNMKDASRRTVELSKNESKKLLATPIGKLYIVDSYSILSGRSGKIVITKMETLLGQTIYHKKFERIKIETPQSISPLIEDNTTNNCLRSLQLDIDTVKQLKNNPLFTRITFKKILQLLEMLSDETCSYDTIAKKLKIDVAVAEYVASIMK